MNNLARRVLHGDILKSLYYFGATSREKGMGALMLWELLDQGKHHEDDGSSLGRATQERAVDALAEKGLLAKAVPAGLGAMLTSYEAWLTPKGLLLLRGDLPEDPDILVGEL